MNHWFDHSSIRFFATALLSLVPGNVSEPFSKEKGTTKPRSDLPQPPRRRISWATVLVPLATGLILATLFGRLYLWEADEIRNNVLTREAQRSVIFSRSFQQDMQAVVKDLRQLADGDGLQSYLLSGKQADLARAIHRACFFSQLNPDYDQVRFIDEQGMEVIRVNFNGEVVPPDKLQNKADRSYFLKANGLAPGQFYISAFDLNVEKGQVEQPLKPMVRIATPIFDANGKRRGIYIINDLGENFIKRLLQFTPQYQQRLRILNARGYWIKAAQPEQEWGFMLPGREGMTLARTDPALWAQVSSQPEGQTPYKGGYFTWHRIVPRQVVDGQLGTVEAGDDYLVIASEVSSVEWAGYFSSLRTTFSIIAVVVLLLVLLNVWFFNMRQRAQQERDRFFTVTHDMLCVAGYDGYFKRVNPAWEETLGYSREEMRSKPFIDFVHPDDIAKTNAVFASLMKGEDLLDFENRYLCKDGTYRWLLWSARALVSEKLVFASARDLTERKKSEEHEQNLSEELKHRADQLEAANKELEAFSYSVSHDLRAPLRHIHGFVEILQKSTVMQKEESSVRHLDIIAKAARNMGMLIDDLLAFSRTGRAEMHFTKVDMRELVDQAIRELDVETDGRKVTWDIKSLPSVSGDPALLRLVWTNLISNALKYSRPRDEAKIEIGHTSVKREGSRGPENLFYVRDNGVGFDMQYAAKLFGVFQRLHRSEDFEGTGIGLANVQRIILRHGGRVWAESQPGSGATFSFSLPLNQKDDTNHVQN